MIDQGQKDMMRADIETALEDVYDVVMNHSEASDIARAPAIMREQMERMISRLETQLADWKRDEDLACPGCGNMPGDGYTAGCEAEGGCGTLRGLAET